jgi:hypothetical protein
MNIKFIVFIILILTVMTAQWLIDDTLYKEKAVSGKPKPPLESTWTSINVDKREIYDVEIKGHSYLFFGQGSIIHAEHCFCKTKSPSAK